MKQIESKKDIELLIETFYGKLLKDETVSHFFVHLNLEEHLPRVVQFWAFILLDEAGYSANMMVKHASLDLDEASFDRWLKLFHETVDQFFEGEKAELAKQRSTLVAWTMKTKFLK
ncbi:group III truncated hemoglobin [Fluviicola sp.]|uniref:group III truncated hemoglobin n=1 Tax=Fluviicola sp. TaxID=1917219 RepID=UPI0031CFCCDF